MGLTVSEVLERARSEFLSQKEPIWDKLAAAITDTTVAPYTVTGSRGTIPRDSVAEFDDDSMELSLVDAVSGTTITPYNRGHLESTAATHLSGTRVLFDNPYPKIVLFNTLKGLISQLYSYGIYVVGYDTASTYTTLEPISLPATAIEPYPFVYVLDDAQRYTELRQGHDYHALYGFSPLKLQFHAGARHGATMHIPYKKAPTTPTALSDDLTTLGVPEGLQPYLPLGIAGILLLGKEHAEVSNENIKRALAGATPPGTRVNVGRALLNQFIQGHVAAEARRLSALTPSRIEHERVV